MSRKKSYLLTNKLVIISFFAAFFSFYKNKDIAIADEKKAQVIVTTKLYDPLFPNQLIEPVDIIDDEYNSTVVFTNSEEDELENIPDGKAVYLVEEVKKKQHESNYWISKEHKSVDIVGGDSLGGSDDDKEQQSYLAEMCYQLSGTILFGTKENELA